MERILVAWIGGLDIDEGLQDRTGPIHSTLESADFTQCHLLYNYAVKAKDTLGYVSWLKELAAQNGTSVNAQYAQLSSPQDFGEIYLAADKLLASIQKQNPKAKITLQITPGTPAMQAVWMLLGKTKYQVEFLQSSKEKGIETAHIPFDISAELQTANQLAHLAQAKVPTHAAFENIVTQNQVMQQLKQRASVLAQHDVPVLIYGQSGTGKELFSTAIHNASKRSDGPLQVINCGAIPPELIDSALFGHKKGAFTGAIENKAGIFEVADSGTLFLDEFGDLPLDAQVRLLRVLQEGEITRVGDTQTRKVNVRIICATNKDLTSAIQKGEFREDLFYRVAVGVINLPPLKERSGDLSLLSDTLLKLIKEQTDLSHKILSPNAKNLILGHAWPGNVRELYSTLLRACLWSQSESISEQDMHEALFTTVSSSVDIMAHDLSQAIDLKGLQDNLEEHYVRLAWHKTSGQKKKAAALLGMKNYQSFDKRLKDYSIN
mgnify:CR=1 FL=1